jgi:hypothetical protein
MRLRKRVFAGDQFAIEQARQQLRIEFLKNRSVTDPRQLGEPWLCSSISRVLTPRIRPELNEAFPARQHNCVRRITEIMVKSHLQLGL